MAFNAIFTCIRVELCAIAADGSIPSPVERVYFSSRFSLQIVESLLVV